MIWLSVCTGLLSIFVAIVPALKGENVNVTFLFIGAFWLIFAVAIRKKKNP